MKLVTVLFQPGFILRKTTPGEPDPITGEPGVPRVQQMPGRGLIQERMWTGVQETTTSGVRDERLIMFSPTNMGVSDVVVTAADEFEDPRGQVWQCITDGHERGIPGKTPEYIATRVRRAKGKR